MANHHIQRQVVIEVHLRVGFHEGHQRQEALRTELSIFRRLDSAEQMLHQRGEVLFPRCFLEDQAAVQSIAAFQLVADHQAAAVLQQRPDAGIEIPGHLLQ